MSCLSLLVDHVDHIRQLFEQELYSNVVTAVSNTKKYTIQVMFVTISVTCSTNATHFELGLWLLKRKKLYHFGMWLYYNDS